MIDVLRKRFTKILRYSFICSVSLQNMILYQSTKNLLYKSTFDLSFFNIPPPCANEEELFVRIKGDGKTRDVVLLVSEFVVEPQSFLFSLISAQQNHTLDPRSPNDVLQPISQVFLSLR